MFKRAGHKYNAVKVFRHGRNWPSKLELAVYELLLMMERGGKLKDLRCQVHVRFHTYDHGKVRMIPDFQAVDSATGETIYFEAKGFQTKEWLRKKKAWAINGPGKLYIYKGSWQMPKIAEIIEPKGEKNE